MQTKIKVERCGSGVRNGSWQPFFSARPDGQDGPHGFGWSKFDAIDDLKKVLREQIEELS